MVPIMFGLSKDTGHKVNSHPIPKSALTLVFVVFAALIIQGCKNGGQDFRNILRGAAKSTARSGQADRNKGISEDGERNMKHAQAENNAIKNCPEGASVRGAAYPEGDSQWCEKKNEEGKAEKHGEFRSWHKNGNLKFTANYNEGLYEGKVVSWHQNGNPRNEAIYRNGIKNGTETEWYKDGSRKEQTTFREGKKSGPYQGWGKDGQTKEKGAYFKDKRHGVWITYGRGGYVESKITYSDDRKNGKAEIYSRDGVLIAVESYRNDVPNGKWITFQNTGQRKSEGNYLAGEKEGQWVDYNRNGEVAKITIYRNGAPLKSTAIASRQSRERRLERHSQFGAKDILGAEPPRRRASGAQRDPEEDLTQRVEEDSSWSPL